jgi:hypothetical protein
MKCIEGDASNSNKAILREVERWQLSDGKCIMCDSLTRGVGVYDPNGNEDLARGVNIQKGYRGLVFYYVCDKHKPDSEVKALRITERLEMKIQSNRGGI